MCVYYIFKSFKSSSYDVSYSPGDLLTTPPPYYALVENQHQYTDVPTGTSDIPTAPLGTPMGSMPPQGAVYVTEIF